MGKFIAYEKLSKKQQKAINSAKRGNWGMIKPITKIKDSAKIYNRKKEQKLRNYSKSFLVSALFYTKSFGLQV